MTSKIYVFYVHTGASLRYGWLCELFRPLKSKIKNKMGVTTIHGTCEWLNFFRPLKSKSKNKIGVTLLQGTFFEKIRQLRQKSEKIRVFEPSRRLVGVGRSRTTRPLWFPTYPGVGVAYLSPLQKVSISQIGFFWLIFSFLDV